MSICRSDDATGMLVRPNLVCQLLLRTVRAKVHTGMFQYVAAVLTWFRLASVHWIVLRTVKTCTAG
jgi:hypothetical protein